MNLHPKLMSSWWCVWWGFSTRIAHVLDPSAADRQMFTLGRHGFVMCDLDITKFRREIVIRDFT
jgi:hypothetical protein